ncbi:MAG: hypothetical protein HRT61_00470 [Ekhidna sp.]|jgi:hypothetical protein|nr:hypothetical protein [Ekhidna sp.]
MRRRKLNRSTPKRKGKRRELGKYKSSLEKEMANELSNHGIKFDYEPESITLVPRFIYKGKYLKMTPKSKLLTDKTGKYVDSITYTPDFVGKEKEFYIEVKGYNKSNITFTLRWKLFLWWLNNNRTENLPLVFIVKNKQQMIEACAEIKKTYNDNRTGE